MNENNGLLPAADRQADSAADAGKRIRIAYAIYDHAKLGGPERYVRELSARFAAQGHDVHVFTTRCPRGAAGGISFHKVPVPRFLPHCLRILLFSRRVRQELGKHEFDIIHSQGPECLVHNVITAHFCFRAWYEITRRLTLFEFLIKFFRPMFRVCLARDKANYASCRAVIAVSRSVRQELLKYHRVPQDRISVVYYGVDLDEFTPGNREKWRRSVRNRLKVGRDAFVVAFVSGESLRKGLSTILRTLRLLKNDAVHLLIVGHVIRLPYILLARLLGVKNRLIFVSPSKNISRYYAASDLFLFPTKYDTFGMVVAEAMASGLPVLVSRTAGAAELIEDPAYLIDDHLDARKIKESVERHIRAGAASEKQRDALRSMVEKYTWEKTALETMRVYRDVMSRAESGRIPSVDVRGRST